MINIETTSALELARHIAARDLSCREVTEHYLARCHASNERLNAYTAVYDDRALQDADAIDQRLSRGERMSPLAGVPIAVKDVLCVQGELTTCGSKMLAGYRATYSATAVERMQAAGMVILGKTNMDEFAMGGSTETGAFGATRNPWDHDRTAGGSSGGSAAALSAGMCALAVGTDTGGSVRQPSAFCGVVGIKPTYGRISRYGLVAFASSLDQVGPMAHHVDDLAACLEVLSGHDQLDSTSLPAAVPKFTESLRSDVHGVRVGVVREYLDHPALASEVRLAVERAEAMLRAAGAVVVDVHLPHTQFAVPTYYLVAPCEASGNLERYDGVHYGYRSDGSSGNAATLDAMIARSRSEAFGDEVKRRIMLGTFALSSGYYDAYYKRALQVRRLIADDYRKAFESVDLLLGPTTPTPPFKLGEKMGDPVQMYLEDLFTVGANLAGIPALSLPAGVTQDGLPTAIQLQGPALGEQILLDVAWKLQQLGLHQPQLGKASDE